MKRTSPNYLRWLEAVVKALLNEREKTYGPLAEIPGEHGSTFSPYNVRDVITKAESQVAVVRWVKGPHVGVPEEFAKQASPGTWVKINGGPPVEVSENVATEHGPALVIWFGDQQVKAGNFIEID